MQSSSIEFCPTIHLTLENMENFSEFVEKLDKQYKPFTGAVKIIPPPEWKPQKQNPDVLKGKIISKPIQQNALLTGKAYQCTYIVQGPISIQKYQKHSEQSQRIIANLKIQDIEKKFWKTIAYSPPIYGSDINLSLMDETAKGWNFNNLDSMLNYALKVPLKGINTSFCYVGAWKTFFCWHREDLDLSAINYNHMGKQKFWYVLQSDDANYLEQQAKKAFPQKFKKCSQYMRHKTTLINPYSLKKNHPQIKIHKIQQKPNQFVIVFGGAYHCGFNCGFNIAEAVNYGTIDWLRQLKTASICKCSSSSISIQYQYIIENLKDTKYSQTKEFQQFSKQYYDVETPLIEEEQILEDIDIKVDTTEKQYEEILQPIQNDNYDLYELDETNKQRQMQQLEKQESKAKVEKTKFIKKDRKKEKKPLQQEDWVPQPGHKNYQRKKQYFGKESNISVE